MGFERHMFVEEMKELLEVVFWFIFSRFDSAESSEACVDGGVVEEIASIISPEATNECTRVEVT